jgi:RNA polymerase sigma factor (sigma-70 family)
MTVDAADLDLARRAGLSLLKKTPSRVHADDLVACAYLVLLKVLPTWDARRSGDRRHFLWDRVRYRVIDELRDENEMHRGAAIEPQTVSLDGRAPADDREDVDDRPLAVPADQERQALHAEIRAAVDTLKPRLAQVIRERFYRDRSHLDIGREMNVNESRVSQLQKEAIATLRSKLAA